MQPKRKRWTILNEFKASSSHELEMAAMQMISEVGVYNLEAVIKMGLEMMKVLFLKIYS